MKANRLRIDLQMDNFYYPPKIEKANKTRISFGMIVLNGEPFLRYNLRSLYPFAHQIIVVEGACTPAAEVATSDGHSTDGTLATLRDFQKREDPESKITIVTARDEGFQDGWWPGKNEMSRAYASRATGDYLWQVDSDEFYDESEMNRFMEILEREKPDTVSFPIINFWGGINYVVNSFYLIRDNAREFHRLFAWRPEYSYKSHFPPTVVDGSGIDLRSKKWIRARYLKKEGIHLYHYSLLFPHQVFNKVKYYKARNQNAIDTWEDSVYRRLEKPFRAHNVYWHIGWLERYTGDHPEQTHSMMKDIFTGALKVETRNCTDVEKLLENRSYLLSTFALRLMANLLSRQPFHFFYRAYGSLKARMKAWIT